MPAVPAASASPGAAPVMGSMWVTKPGMNPAMPTKRKTIPKISAKVRVLIMLSDGLPGQLPPVVLAARTHAWRAGSCARRASDHRRRVVDLETDLFATLPLVEPDSPGQPQR